MMILLYVIAFSNISFRLATNRRSTKENIVIRMKIAMYMRLSSLLPSIINMSIIYPFWIRTNIHQLFP